MSQPQDPGVERAPFPAFPARAHLEELFAERVAPPPRRPGDRMWVQVLLLVLTVVTTTLVGGCHYLSFELSFQPVGQLAGPTSGGPPPWPFSEASFYLKGLWYSLTVLAILGCHEMGHYVACLRYGVDATRPYFLPAPPPFLTGTFGAFIRIRSRFPSKVALFDIGIAGPIAGFVVAVPSLVAGLMMSSVVRLPADSSGLISLGEPLLFRGVAWLVFGDVPDGYSINMHPMAFAAWFGLLATALNLLPAAQLDGGHIAYAVLGQRARLVTIGTVLAVVLLNTLSFSWALWAALLILMVRIVGLGHPPTLDDHTPLDSTRLWLALFALIMLVVCFTPVPIETFVTGQ